MLSSRRDRLVKRQGETGPIPFRTGRFFSQNGSWYFMTREGRAEGPYREKHEAERAVEMYIRMANFRDIDAMPVIRDFTPSSPVYAHSALVSSGLIR